MSPSLVPLMAGHADLERRLVVRAEARVRLTTRESRLLAYLAERPNQAVSREELLVEVCDYAPGVVSRALDTAVRRLRQKIEANPSDPVHVLSEHGVGYRFVPAVTQSVGPDDLVPRPELEDAVRAALAQHRVVTLWGPGGIGKTTVAQSVLRGLGRPVVRVDLGGVRPGGALRAIGSRLGLSVEQGGSVEAVSRALGQRRAVLFLDEAEGVIEELAALLTPLEQTVLLTSRRRVGLPIEQVVRVPPFTEDQSVRLLRCWTDRLGLAPAPVAELTGVARALDGLPLALELAAARTLFTPFEEQLRGLERAGPVEERLQASVRQSLTLLDPLSLRTLSALTLFRVPFTAEDALGAVGEASVDILQGLVEASLVQRTPAGQLRVLTVIRLVVAHEAPPTEAQLLAWMRWLTDALERCNASIGRFGGASMRRLRGLMPEVLRIVEDPRTEAHPAVLASLVRATRVASEALTPVPQRRRLFQVALRAPERLPARVHAELLATYALFLARTDGDPSALQVGERAVEIAAQVGPALHAWTLHWLGRCHAALGQVEAGLRSLQLAVAAVHGRVDEDSRLEHAHAQAQLGVLMARLDPGLRDEALRRLGESLSTLLPARARSAVGLLNAQGRLLQERGDAAAAAAVLRRAADTAERTGDLRMETGMRANLGLTLLSSDPADARVQLLRADRLSDHLGLVFIRALVHSNLAWLDLFEGQPARAAERLEARLPDVARPWYRSVFASQAALAHLLAGRPERARACLDEARGLVWLDASQQASATAIVERVAAALEGLPDPPPAADDVPEQVRQLIDRFDRVLLRASGATDPR